MQKPQRDVPLPKFRRFERVVVATAPRHQPHVAGEHGTVLWANPPQRRDKTARWTYCVYLHGKDCCITTHEPDLRPAGGFDLEEAHLGRCFEVSYDLLPDEDDTFDFVEGTYRLPGRFWQVMIFTRSDVPALAHRPTTWRSGITGVVFGVPRKHRLDKAYVERALSEVFGADRWVEVRGPDSMVLR